MRKGATKRSEKMEQLSKTARFFKVLRMELGLTQRELARVLEISPGSVYKYENTQMKPGIRIIEKVNQLCDERNLSHVIEGLDEEIHLINKETDIEGDSMNANYIIDLQRDKIEHQKAEIDKLKLELQSKTAEATHWDALDFDYTSNCTLIRRGVQYGRIINQVTHLDVQSKTLGYSEKELNAFWDVGTQYDDFYAHPSDKLYDKETLKDMRRQMSTLPHIFNSLKSIVGDHYIPQSLLFICKDGTFKGAIAFCKVEWWDMKIEAKVRFCQD